MLQRFAGLGEVIANRDQEPLVQDFGIPAAAKPESLVQFLKSPLAEAVRQLPQEVQPLLGDPFACLDTSRGRFALRPTACLLPNLRESVR